MVRTDDRNVCLVLRQQCSLTTDLFDFLLTLSYHCIIIELLLFYHCIFIVFLLYYRCRPIVIG